MADSSTATISDMVDTVAVVDMVDTTDAAAADMNHSSTAVDVNELLTEEQLEALIGIAVGDLIFVVKELWDDEEDDMDENDGDEEGAEDEVDGEGEDEENHEGEDEEEGGDEQDGDGNEDMSESEHDSNSDDTETPAEIPTPPRMFIVTAITSTDEGDVKDIKLQQMTYSQIAHAGEPHSFQVYGNQTVHRHSADKCNACKDTVSITTVLTDPSYAPLPSPPGDYVRRMDRTISTNASQQCTTGCRDGWLLDRQVVNSLIANHDSPVLAWDGELDDVPLQAAVCPVCIGLDLFKEQEQLQHTLLTDGRVDLGEVISHEGRLNPRRAALGYPFNQFDERLWGMYFDDMDGEEGEGGVEGGWDDPYEHFPEALDPNAYIRLNPASEATIAALPRKLFGETGNSTAKCGVCMDQLKEDSVVILLPCGHAEHHAECLELWLRQQETCTVCRRVVPTANIVAEPVIEKDGEMEEEFKEEGEAVSSESDAAGDLPPTVAQHGQHTDTATSSVPALLPSSSWVTVDDDVTMSDV